MSNSLFFATCAGALLFCACVVDGPSPIDGPGAIKGVVGGSESLLVQGYATIPGTNFIANADSLGRFQFYGVPAGAYRVELCVQFLSDYASRCTTVVATVGAGDTTDLGQVDLDREGAAGQTSCYYLLSVQYGVFDGRDTAAIAAPWISYSTANVGAFLTIVYTDAESVFVGFDVASDAGRIIATYEGDTLCRDCSPKGRLLAGNLWPVHRTGNDTLTLTSSNDSLCSQMLVLLDASARTNLVYVTTGASSLRRPPCDAKVFRVVVEAETSCVSVNLSERVDWDIYFVNDSTGDSCYFGNRQTCVASFGDCATHPMFQGDECIPSTSASTTAGKLGCSAFTADEITAANIKDGSYSIYVNYYDGPPDSATATSRLTVELGLEDGRLVVGKLFQMSSPRPMSRGETWHAGKIHMPERTYEPGSVITPAGLGKMRAKRR